jgi:hypothetical protein
MQAQPKVHAQLVRVLVFLEALMLVVLYIAGPLALVTLVVMFLQFPCCFYQNLK